MNFSPHELPESAQAPLVRGVQEKLAAIMVSELNPVYENIRALNFSGAQMKIENGIVGFDGTYENSTSEANALATAHQLSPWRKGPFRLNRLVIDAEWRSDKKWDRLLPELSGKTVADVGCNNGYYLFRIAEAGARRVLGFDPTLKYWLQFQFIARHAPELPVGFLPLGWQALEHLADYFDVIFLMGVNYHDPEPAEMFHACRHALKSGGLLVCESVVIDSPAQLEIFPSGKYAGIGGVYAIPTPATLAAQLGRAGFKDVKVQHCVAMTAKEQRATEFSPQKSFADVGTGGYPPLYRAALFATKP